MSDPGVPFAFGKNWARFVRTHFSAERVETSVRQLLETLGRPDLEDQTFLDIGCGSGIHSLAAVKAGAAQVVSFDVDPDSVATTRRVREMVGSPERWQVFEGSVLDDAFVATLPIADIVYSWGVLHHTGDLWTAVRRAATRVAAGGVFLIAVYERTEMSEHWIEIKKAYNRASWWGRRRIEIPYLWRTWVKGRTPRHLYASFKEIVGYRRLRGMAFWTDVRDWLGGWPYEPATSEEMCAFLTNELGLVELKVVTGEANIEYLFSRL